MINTIGRQNELKNIVFFVFMHICCTSILWAYNIHTMLLKIILRYTLIFTQLHVFNKVFLLQKKAVRIIQGVNRRAHSEPLFSSLCVLSVRQVYVYNIGLVMYKYHHGLLPHISHMFEKNSSIHQYNTRQSNLLHVPCCRTELGKRSFRYKAVTIWNVIFENISVDIEIGNLNGI